MPKSRLVALDALRGFAALIVLAIHFEGLLYFVPPNGHAKPETLLLHYGVMGIELFFVVSGFVILLTLEAAPTVLRFAVNRVARLYPAYWASVVATAVYLLLWKEAGLKTAAVNLTMFQKFVGVRDLVTPYWSLAYELWFYVVVAVIAALGALRRIAAVALAWFALAITMQVLDVHPHGVGAVLTLQQFGHLFIAGMMLYLLHTGRGTRLVKVVLVSCVGYSLFGRPDWSAVPRHVYFLVNGAFIGLVYLVSRGWLDWISRPWLVAVGTISYSLYLFHFTVGMALVRAARLAGAPAWVGVAAAIPASFAVGALSRRFIEVPGQHAIQRGIGRRADSARLPTEAPPA